MGHGVVFRGQTAARYTRFVGRTPLRIVSALLMSVMFTVPVLGAVCSMLCEPAAGTRAHRSHAAGVHHSAAGRQTSEHHHAHAGSVDTPSVDTAAAHHHHAASPASVSDPPQPSEEWNGRCCDQPALTLAAIPVVRHELQIDPAVFDTASGVLRGSDVRPADPRRHTSRAPSLPRPSNPILRI